MISFIFLKVYTLVCLLIIVKYLLKFNNYSIKYREKRDPAQTNKKIKKKERKTCTALAAHILLLAWLRFYIL